jgi:thiamine pyrophosphokinase
MLPDKKFRSILCLNGELPDKSFFETDLPVIAVDGAINKLVHLSVSPLMIIGDMDSADPAHLAIHTHVLTPDQSTSDFEKSLVHLKKEDLLPAIIVGINGGCLDHVLHNINLFLETDSVFYAPPIIGFMIKAGQTQELYLHKSTKISLIGMPSANVTSTGLKWNLNKSDLNFPGKNSCFNRAIDPKVEISVHSGNLLTMYYEHPILDAGL